MPVPLLVPVAGAAFALIVAAVAAMSGKRPQNTLPAPPPLLPPSSADQPEVYASGSPVMPHGVGRWSVPPGAGVDWKAPRRPGWWPTGANWPAFDGQHLWPAAYTPPSQLPLPVPGTWLLPPSVAAEWLARSARREPRPSWWPDGAPWPIDAAGVLPGQPLEEEDEEDEEEEIDPPVLPPSHPPTPVQPAQPAPAQPSAHPLSPAPQPAPQPVAPWVLPSGTPWVLPNGQPAPAPQPTQPAPAPQPQQAPAATPSAPLGHEETVESPDVYLARILLGEEQAPNWRRVSPEVKAWQASRGLSVDGKFGPGSAKELARRGVGVLPLVRYWPLGGRGKTPQVEQYRAELYAIAATLADPHHAAALRASAERERGQGWPTQTAQPQPAAEQQAVVIAASGGASAGNGEAEGILKRLQSSNPAIAREAQIDAEKLAAREKEPPKVSGWREIMRATRLAISPDQRHVLAYVAIPGGARVCISLPVEDANAILTDIQTEMGLTTQIGMLGVSEIGKFRVRIRTKNLARKFRNTMRQLKPLGKIVGPLAAIASSAVLPGVGAGALAALAAANKLREIATRAPHVVVEADRLLSASERNGSKAARFARLAMRS